MVVLMLHRQDGSVDFYRYWEDYKTGFGDYKGEFWLGLDQLHQITTARSCKVRITMEAFNGDQFWAEYSQVSVGPESDNYRLSVSGYSGNGGNSLSYHDGYQFSTRDRDNDVHVIPCAERYKGAWWYRGCSQCNPTGLYFQGGQVNESGVSWIYAYADRYSFKTFTMVLTMN